MDDAASGTRRQAQERCVDQPLQVARRPRRVIESRQAREILDDARAGAGQRHLARLRRLRQVELGIRIAVGRADGGKLVQQPALERAWLDFVLLAGELVDDTYPHPRRAQPVAQLGGEKPLDLLAAQAADALEKRADLELGAAFGEEHSALRDLVARVPLAHRHLIGTLVGAGRGHRQCVADGPKAQESDTELALQAIAPALCLQVALDRVANVRGDVLEVRQPFVVTRDAVAVILDREVVRAILAAARDDDRSGARVDAVFHELGDGLERVALRERDDPDRIPVVADPEFAAGIGFVLTGDGRGSHQRPEDG